MTVGGSYSMFQHSDYYRVVVAKIKGCRTSWFNLTNIFNSTKNIPSSDKVWHTFYSYL